MSVALSCFSSVCNTWTGLDRVSKYLASHASAAVRSARKFAWSRNSSAKRADRSLELQIFAQEELLLGQQQRSFGPVDVLDAHQLAYLQARRS